MIRTDSFLGKSQAVLEDFFTPSVHGARAGRVDRVKSAVSLRNYLKRTPSDSIIGDKLADQVNKISRFASNISLNNKSATPEQVEESSPDEVFRTPSPQPRNKALPLHSEVEERAARRIALRLHDESVQMLATVYLELADIARDCPDPIAIKIGKVVTHVDEVWEQLRNLSHELRPRILEQQGLMPALQLLGDGVRRRSGVSVVVSGRIAQPLEKKIETVLYRVVQEALSNVVRHAGATHVQVRLKVEEEIVHCSVRDNGNGFKRPAEGSDAATGLGLAGIHERVAELNGNCKIASRRGKGTKLQVSIPL